MQCVITKWDGNRCENLTDSDGSYLCPRHAAQRSQSAPDDPAFKNVFEQVERSVKFAGSVAGLIGGVIKIAEFVMEHSSKIRALWSTNLTRCGDRAFAEERKNKYSDAKRVELVSSATRIDEECKRILGTDSVTQTDLKALAVTFDDWFEALPVKTRRDAKRHFGELYFEAIRNGLSDGQPTVTDIQSQTGRDGLMDSEGG